MKMKVPVFIAAALLAASTATAAHAAPAPKRSTIKADPMMMSATDFVGFYEQDPRGSPRLMIAGVLV
jgi:hypothetical protein